MNRRRLLAALAVSALGPALAHAGPSRTPLAVAFLLLEDYLKLAATKRDLFHFAYLARHKDKPAPDAKATYVLADGTRTPVAFAADGEVTNLPTLDQLKSKATFETDGPPLDFALEMRVSAAPATRLEGNTLVRALAQANAAVSIFTEGQGARLTHAYFPDGGAGRAVYADGHVAALLAFNFPSLGQILYLDLSHASGVSAIELDHAPSRVMLAGPPHRTLRHAAVGLCADHPRGLALVALVALAGRGAGRRMRGNLALAGILLGLGEPVDPPSKHLAEASHKDEEGPEAAGDPPRPGA